MTLLFHTGDSTWAGVPCPALSVPQWWLRVLVLSEQALTLLLVSDVLPHLWQLPCPPKKKKKQTLVTWLSCALGLVLNFSELPGSQPQPGRLCCVPSEANLVLLWGFPHPQLSFNSSLGILRDPGRISPSSSFLFL